VKNDYSLYSVEREIERTYSLRKQLLLRERNKTIRRFGAPPVRALHQKVEKELLTEKGFFTEPTTR